MLSARSLAVVADQLGHPRGPVEHVVGRWLNRGKRGCTQSAVGLLPKLAGAVWADVGFGGGLGLQLLMQHRPAGGQVHGVEISRGLLQSAARRFRSDLDTERLQLHQASLEHLPLPTHGIDGVITLNSVYFLTDADLTQALAELERVLAPGGRLILGAGDPAAMARLPFAGTLQIRPIDQLERALAAAGLEVVEHHRVGVAADAFHLLLATPR